MIHDPYLDIDLRQFHHNRVVHRDHEYILCFIIIIIFGYDPSSRLPWWL